MKKTSKNLNSWANFFLIVAIVYIVIAIIGFCMDSAWTGDAIDTSIIALVLSPAFRGLSVLVQNAEEQMEARLKEWLEDDDEVEG